MIFSGLGDWKRVSMRRSKMYNNTIYYTSTSRAPIVTMTDHKDGITRQLKLRFDCLKIQCEMKKAFETLSVVGDTA